MRDDAGTAEELPERSIGTVSPLALLTCFSSERTLCSVFVTVGIVSDKGRAGGGESLC